MNIYRIKRLKIKDMIIKRKTNQTKNIEISLGDKGMKERRKEILKSLGDRLSFAIVINFYIWLFFAMFKGKGYVVVYFNHFNEALIEYIVYIIIFPIMLYALLKDLKESKRKRRERLAQKIPERYSRNSIEDN